MKKKNADNPLKKTWNFLWNDDSLLSWVVFLIVIFVFIKFIFFPTLSLIFGTSLPIVIVESCSMYHDSNFDEWWEGNQEWYLDKDIERGEFENFPLRGGFTKGDVFFVTGVDKDNIELGDVIIFSDSRSFRPVIHRVVSLDPLQTKGDNNIDQIPFEKDINPKSIVGRTTRIRIPLIGWLKLIFFEPFRSNGDRGVCR